jgi:hypothetical protein
MFAIIMRRLLGSVRLPLSSQTYSGAGMKVVTIPRFSTSEVPLRGAIVCSWQRTFPPTPRPPVAARPPSMTQLQTGGRATLGVLSGAA